MKRTAMKRTAPIARGAWSSTNRRPMRRTRMRPSAKGTKYGNRERDFVFMGWVKRQPCAVAELLGVACSCEGVIEADHQGYEPGLGIKAPDDTCVPMCKHHHEQRHQRRGYFLGWTAPQVRAWCDDRIQIYQARFTAWQLTVDNIVF